IHTPQMTKKVPKDAHDNDNEINTSGDAFHSGNGYLFQIIRLIHLILTDYKNKENATVELEHGEDICVKYDENNTTYMTFYQEKYVKNTESITKGKDCGIMKVIKRHYNNHSKIHEIMYEVTH